MCRNTLRVTATYNITSHTHFHRTVFFFFLRNLLKVTFDLDEFKAGQPQTDKSLTEDTSSKSFTRLELEHSEGCTDKPFFPSQMYDCLDIKQPCADLYRRLIPSIYGEAVLLFPQHPLILPTLMETAGVLSNNSQCVNEP